MTYLSFLCSLEKRVNKKVMAMFEKAEDEYNDLMSKKNIIEVTTHDLSGYVYFFYFIFSQLLLICLVLVLLRMINLKSRR